MAKKTSTLDVLLPLSVIVFAVVGLYTVWTHPTPKAQATPTQQVQKATTTQLKLLGTLPPIAVNGQESTPAPALAKPKPVATTAKPAPPAPAVAGPVIVGGVQLIGCKPKPGVDANAWWAQYMKDSSGAAPYWPYVRSQVCA